MGPTRVLFRFLKYIFPSKDLSLLSMPYAWLIHVCVIHTAVCMTLLTYSWHLYLNAKSSQSICVSFWAFCLFLFYSWDWKRWKLRTAHLALEQRRYSPTRKAYPTLRPPKRPKWQMSLLLDVDRKCKEAVLGLTQTFPFSLLLNYSKSETELVISMNTKHLP